MKLEDKKRMAAKAFAAFFYLWLLREDCQELPRL